MTSVVYGFIRAATEGWGDPITIGAFGVGLLLLASFCASSAVPGSRSRRCGCSRAARGRAPTSRACSPVAGCSRCSSS
jgi:hypothetical protein